MSVSYTYDSQHVEVKCGDWVYNTVPIEDSNVRGLVIVPQHSQAQVVGVFSDGSIRVELPMAQHTFPCGSRYVYSFYGTFVGQQYWAQAQYKKDTDEVSIRPSYGGRR